MSRAQPGKPQLFVLPTGTGKTMVAIEIAERFSDKGPVLITMHLKELVEQWRHSFEASGWTVFVDRGDERTREIEVTTCVSMGQKVVVITTMQTMRDTEKKRRLSKWTRPEAFSLCLIDEAHRALALSHREAMAHFDMVSWVGATATPGRRGLANIFELAYEKNLYEMMVVEGWLTPLVWVCPPVNWAWKDLKPPAGDDISQADLDRYYESEEGLEAIRQAQRRIRAYMHENAGQALIFMPTARTAELVASWLSTEMTEKDQEAQIALWMEEEGMELSEARAKIGAVATPVGTEAVTAKTPSVRRDLTMRRFRNGTVRAVTNFGVFTEGVNVDDINMVFMLRPTINQDLYIQMIGRGARLHSSIKHAIGQCETPAERHALIAASPKPRCTVVQLVPMRHGKIDFCGPHTLMYDVLPQLSRDAIRASVRDGMTLAEMKALAEEAERERLERERAEQERAEREQMLEYEKRRERSPYLVMQGDIAIGGETMDLVGQGARLLTYPDLQKTWAQYRETGRTPCGDAKTFNAAKKAVVEYWHERAKNADRERFKKATSLPAYLNGRTFGQHWRRWKSTRMEKEPRYRPPGKQAEFDQSRQAMADRFRAYLVHEGMGDRAAHKAAASLFMLSSAWTGKGVANEMHYWWTALDPSHENPAAAYASPRRRVRTARRMPGWTPGKRA